MYLVKASVLFLSSYLYVKIANEHIKIYSVILIEYNSPQDTVLHLPKLAKILKSDTNNC